MLTINTSTMKHENGSIFGVRMDADVALLVERAIRSGQFKNNNRLGNAALRKFLTPMFPSKRVAELQKKIEANA